MIVTYESHLEETRAEMRQKMTSLGVSLGEGLFFKNKKIYRSSERGLVPADDITTIVSRSAVRGGGFDEIPFNQHNWGDAKEEFVYLSAKEAVEPEQEVLVEVDPTPIVVVVKPQPPVKGRRSRKSKELNQLALEV